MSDIAQLLRDAVVAPSALDLDRVHREGRRRRQRPRKVAGALMALFAVVGVTAILATRDQPRDTPVIAPPPTHGPTPSTVAPTTVPVTTAPVPTTLPPGEDRLSTQSRLGFAGLGPIKLGMTFADAELAGQVVFRNDGCGYSMAPAPGRPEAEFSVSVNYSGSPNVQQIQVNAPEISTISGIHVGSTRDDVLQTYPSASGVAGVITIMNAEGRVIDFFMAQDKVVSMFLWQQGKKITVDSRC